jgi:hypothetical protein
LKVGIDYVHEKAKLRWNFSTRTFLNEAAFTYLARKNLILGLNTIIDPRTANVEKYDFAVSWSPADNSFVGLKHESKNKKSLELGKFFLFFNYSTALA